MVDLKRLVPAQSRRWLRRQQRRFSVWPPVGFVPLGSLARTRPISSVFGFDRGDQIDRFYIESFLARHAVDIHGTVLEIADDSYTRRFGGDRVTRAEVLHVQSGHRGATLVADLADGSGLPSNHFDCAIVTQTLQFIYDTRAALTNLHCLLKPGGVLLATVPGISQISRYDMERWGDFWRFTELSARRLVGEVFRTEHTTVESYGNVLAAVALLHGLAQEDVGISRLQPNDPDYPVIVTIRAVKPVS